MAKPFAKAHSTLRQRLQEGSADLSPAEGQFLDFLLRNYAEIPFLSATDIAGRLGLNSSGLTRFAQRQGFTGYPDLQKQVRAALRQEMALTQPVEPEGLGGYWKHERRNLEELSRLSEADFGEAVRMLTEARKVWVMGARASYVFAYHAWHYLASLRPEVHLLSPDLLSRPEALLDVSANDVVLAFSVRRYAMATRQVVDRLQKCGAPLLLVTDQGASPLVRQARLTLRVPTQGVEPFDSLAPVLSLGHALVVACAARLGTARLEEAERLWADYETFEY